MPRWTRGSLRAFVLASAGRRRHALPPTCGRRDAPAHLVHPPGSEVDACCSGVRRSRLRFGRHTSACRPEGVRDREIIALLRRTETKPAVRAHQPLNLTRLPKINSSLLTHSSSSTSTGRKSPARSWKPEAHAANSYRITQPRPLRGAAFLWASESTAPAQFEFTPPPAMGAYGICNVSPVDAS